MYHNGANGSSKQPGRRACRQSHSPLRRPGGPPTHARGKPPGEVSGRSPAGPRFAGMMRGRLRLLRTVSKRGFLPSLILNCFFTVVHTLQELRTVLTCHLLDEVSDRLVNEVSFEFIPT